MSPKFEIGDIVCTKNNIEKTIVSHIINNMSKNPNFYVCEWKKGNVSHREPINENALFLIRKKL